MRDWLVNLPNELTEADLIDMVDGTLPASREPIAIAALRAEPRLGLLVKQMRLDKATLIGLPAEPAPERVGEGVLEEIDARTLRALAAESQEHSSGIPIHSLQIDAPSHARAIVETPLFRFAAAAAAVLLVVGIGAYVVRELNHQPKPETQIARQTPPIAVPSPSPAPVPPGPALPAPGESLARADSHEQLADAPPPPPPPSTPSQPEPAASLDLALSHVDSSPAPTSAVPENTAPTTSLAAANPEPRPEPPPVQPAPAPPAITPAMASRLAHQGRLALLVKPKDVPATLKRLDTLVRVGAQSPAVGAGQRELVWRSMDPRQAPARLAALVQPDAPSGSPSSSNPSEPPTIAGSSGPSGERRVDPAPAPSLPRARPMIKAIYTVEIDPSERGVIELARILGESDSAVVTFQALQDATTPPLSLDPDAVLWWTGSPARWVRPAAVPIVIEGMGIE